MNKQEIKDPFLKIRDFYQPISNGHEQVWSGKIKGFTILGGNSVTGYHIPDKNNLCKVWKQIVKNTGNFQDIELYFNDNQIRVVRNFDKRILDKSTTYQCYYKKIKPSNILAPFKN